MKVRALPRKSRNISRSFSGQCSDGQPMPAANVPAAVAAIPPIIRREGPMGAFRTDFADLVRWFLAIEK